MAFTTWASVLSDMKDVIAGRKTENWFLSSIENSREMRTTYTQLGNFTQFYEWVASKAAEEALGGIEGQMFTSIGV